MNEAELKTSVKQRVVISIIAFVMLGSVIASYVAIVAGGSGGSSSTEISDEKAAEYQAAYVEKLEEFQTASLSDFQKFSNYLSHVSAYDEEAANAGGVVSKDYLEGDGRELTDGDSNYLAYYVGWCADGTIFDSSLDDNDSPRKFAKVLNASQGMIQGWIEGIIGMKLGGVRRITVPGEQAYGSSMELCGGYNKPLRFLVLAVPNEDPMMTLAGELDTAYMKARYASYGMDYDAIISQ